MSANTKIEWAHHTFNPWWGCQRVSEACRNCYAETFAKRTGHDIWGPPATTSRRLFKDPHWFEPVKWDRAADAAGERHRVFCASMADVFEDHPEVWNERNRLWDLIAETPNLIWLLLTKRPENIAKMVPQDWLQEWDGEHGWPDNVWPGTTVEDQPNAETRLPHLIALPSDIHFVSMEPLLGPVDMEEWLGTIDYTSLATSSFGAWEESGPGVNWLITGGESGVHARPSHPAWFRSLRDQCQAAGVPFHFKQWGEWAPTEIRPGGDLGGDVRRGRTVHLHAPGNPEGYFRKGDAYMSRVGTKAAGRQLDGVEHSAFPEVRSVVAP